MIYCRRHQSLIAIMSPSSIHIMIVPSSLAWVRVMSREITVARVLKKDKLGCTKTCPKSQAFLRRFQEKKTHNKTYLKTKLLFQDSLHILDPWGDVIRIKIFIANRSFSSQTPDYPLKPMGFTQLLQELINRKLWRNSSSTASVKS